MSSDYEQRAGEILAAELRGQVNYRDVPGAPPGTHDFDVVCPDGKTIAVEVTSVRDPEAEEFWRAVSKQQWGATTLSKSWVLDVDSEARVSTLRAHIEEALRALEQAGTKQFSEAFGSAAPEELQRLGVRSGRAFDWSPPYIYVTGGAGGAVDVEDLRRAVERVAQAPDNRNKLRGARAAGAAGGHLFVWVDPLNHAVAAAFHFMRTKAPSAPRLPPEIDVVWVARPTRTDDHGRICCEELWKVDRRCGWAKIR